MAVTKAGHISFLFSLQSSGEHPAATNISDEHVSIFALQIIRYNNLQTD